MIAEMYPKDFDKSKVKDLTGYKQGMGTGIYVENGFLYIATSWECGYVGEHLKVRMSDINDLMA